MKNTKKEKQRGKFLKRSKILLILLLIVPLVLFLLYGDVFDFSFIKQHQKEITDIVDKMPLQAALFYFLIYIFIAAFSLPGATVMGLLGGAVFGFWRGLLLTSFASSIGATLSFLLVRYLFREKVQRKFQNRLKIVNKGIAKEGAFYLFSLRLVPIFPFFLINILMALTPLRTSIFYITSQIGMLPGTAVYINAGTQLAELESVPDIFSPQIILSFVLLGAFPLLAKRFLSWFPKQQKKE